MQLFDEEMAFQTCLNYYVSVTDLLIYKGALKASGFGYDEARLKILHRQILTLVKSEQHKQAKHFTVSQLNGLTRNEQRIAAFGSQLGVRSKSLKNIRDEDITYLKEGNTPFLSIFLREMKYCPSGRARYIEVHCCCNSDVSKKFCFLHSMSLPDLPISALQLKEVVEALGSTSHTFRRTLALMLRCFHERFGIIDVDLVNILFFWKDNSRMYITRYTYDWHHVIDLDLPVFFPLIDRCVLKSKQARWETIKKLGLGTMKGKKCEKVDKLIDETMKKDRLRERHLPDKDQIVVWEDAQSTKDKKKKKDGKYGPALVYDAVNRDRWPQRTEGWIFPDGPNARYKFVQATVVIFITTVLYDRFNYFIIRSQVHKKAHKRTSYISDFLL